MRKHYEMRLPVGWYTIVLSCNDTKLEHIVQYRPVSVKVEPVAVAVTLHLTWELHAVFDMAFCSAKTTDEIYRAGSGA